MKRKKFNILVVEDELITRMYMVDLLKNLGHTVAAESSTGEEAVDLVNNNGINLIFMDIRLAGDIDGIKAAQMISTNNDIPIIFISAYEYKEKVAGFNNKNFKCFLSKPVDPSSLIRAIESI